MPRTDTLKVPGAGLYHEVRGTGPVLLLICGGSSDAGIFTGLADALADHYTVVSYDPRGNSRSPFDGPAYDQSIEVHADDAHRLLAHVTDSPALVFGSSSGALAGLELLVTHPEQVRGLVAHEPPGVRLLPDAAEHLAFFESVYETYRRDGVEAGMRLFGAGVGMDGPSGPPPPPETMPTLQRMLGNTELFLAHEVRQFPRYLPDAGALAALPGRLVLAGGAASRAHLPYRPALALAGTLGLELVDFPGDHIGYLGHPVEFAAQLTEVLGRFG
ncbi:alpha/beta hydrolase [Longispora sp. K20-0274]|uniref:alpha/beta fold hydrolase n=1 Tax=Longispora sp. K20-0274 TaxID=3088255 RepID=UPI0039997F2E